MKTTTGWTKVHITMSDRILYQGFCTADSNPCFRSNGGFHVSLKNNLKLGDQSIELGDGVGDSSGAGALVLQSCVVADSLHSDEEFISSFLLRNRRREVHDGTTGLVHETAEFVGDLEPLFLLDVSGEPVETNLGLGNDGLLAGNVLLTIALDVKRVGSFFSVDRVRRVSFSRLVGSVGAALGVGSTISEKTENRESRRFSCSGVGNGRDQSYSSSSNSGKGITAGSLLLDKDASKCESKQIAANISILSE
jgi:hypothetical protein